MVTVAKSNFQRKQAGLPLIRFDLLRLGPDDVQDLRDAYAAMYEISDTAIGDSRGYTALARGHGYDQGLCHDDNRIFLTWHRAYIYYFEKALNTALRWKRNDDELELTLPYWNWTQFDASTHAANGIPKVLDDANYTNAAGDTVENPLARAKSLYRSVSQGLSGEAAFTQRFPNAFRSSIPLLEDDVAKLMTNPNFMSFQDDFDFGAHGSVHVNVGGNDPSSPLPGSIGDMRSINSASFDPIFWIHHCMCDKVWFDWQALHPGVSVPDHVLDTPVYGGKPGRDFIDAENSLRYVYSANAVEVADVLDAAMETLALGESLAPASPVREVPLGSVSGGFARAQLDFHSLRPPRESFEIRAFVENPNCSESTGYDHESFAGRMVLFGHGECHGAPGHCDPDLAPRDAYDIRSKHPLRYRHTRYCLDLTRGLRRYMSSHPAADNIRIYLLTLDGDGNAVTTDSVRYEGCSLRTFA